MIWDWARHWWASRITASIPADALAGLPRLGGTKNPDIERIIALKPDLVLANQEENTRPAVEALEAAGIFVWVTFPRSVRAALDVLWTLAGLFQSRPAVLRIETLELTLEWAQTAAAARPPLRYFCPIWCETPENGPAWYMTFNQTTYMHDLLGMLGGENVFAARERRYPLQADLGLAPAEDPAGRDVRYPRLPVDEIAAAAPELILLPDEPFAFDESHKERLAALLPETPAVRNGRLHCLDGSLLTWHGTRLARALQTLPGLLA